MNFADIAYKEYRNLQVFRELAKKESDPEFKDLLDQLVAFENYHFEFWRDLAKPHTYHLKPWVLGTYRLVRKIFGLTFTLRLLEMQEGDFPEEVREYLFNNPHPRSKEIEEIINISEPQEQKLMRQIKEEHVEFMGSIVLGLNDGLIELSGALTGFSFAFRHTTTIVLAGFILGISASLSMASSAYLQARHERGKDPTKSALYTGGAYMIVVLLLIVPFLVIPVIEGAIAVMVAVVIAIVTGLSFYTAVIFKREFIQSLREMLLFSIGTTVVTFLIGISARQFLGLEI